MKPFSKDLFSDSVPVWTECKKETAEKIVDLVQSNLAAYSNVKMSVFQVGGLEINSSNYKITTDNPDQSIVLKKWPKDTDIEKVKFHNDILSFLSEKGVPSPTLISFDNTQGYFEHQGQYWTGQSYQAGSFYDGNVSLIKELIAQAVNLHTSLTEFHTKNSQYQFMEVVYDIEIIDKLKDNLPDFNRYFLPEHVQLLESNWNLIVEEHGFAINTLKKYTKKDLCHLDLHPHNILTDADSVISFLDFDSVKLINRPIALAYFALKTCKQICALNEVEPATIGNSFLNELSQASTEMKDAAQDLSYLANAEVTRRICIILRLSIEKNNSNWNHVLPILINHLTESKILFRQL